MHWTKGIVLILECRAEADLHVGSGAYGSLAHRGHCTEDVTAIVCRKKHNAWDPPPVCHPPRSILRSLRSGRCDRGPAIVVFNRIVHAPIEPYRQSGKVLEQFMVLHIVRVVLVTGSLRSASKFGFEPDFRITVHAPASVDKSGKCSSAGWVLGIPQLQSYT